MQVLYNIRPKGYDGLCKGKIPQEYGSTCFSSFIQDSGIPIDRMKLQNNRLIEGPPDIQRPSTTSQAPHHLQCMESALFCWTTYHNLPILACYILLHTSIAAVADMIISFVSVPQTVAKKNREWGFPCCPRVSPRVYLFAQQLVPRSPTTQPM